MHHSFVLITTLCCTKVSASGVIQDFLKEVKPIVIDFLIGRIGQTKRVQSPEEVVTDVLSVGVPQSFRLRGVTEKQDCRKEMA